MAVVSEDCFQLINKSTGKVIADSSGRASVYERKPWRDQYWFVQLSGDFVKIINRKSGHCLAASLHDGRVHMLPTSESKDEMRWALIPDGNHFKLVNCKTNRILAESSCTGKLCAFNGRSYEDQMWKAEPDTLRSVLVRAIRASWPCPRPQQYNLSDSAPCSEQGSSIDSTEWNRVTSEPVTPRSLMGSVGSWEVVQPPSQQGENLTSATIDQEVKRCFLSNTAFLLHNGDLRLVNRLQEGDLVRLAGMDAGLAQVSYVRILNPDKRSLVELVTNQATVKISENHRIVVGAGKRIAAKDLKVGQSVWVGQRERALAAVRHSDEKVELVDVRFTPDLPVEAFVIPAYGLNVFGAEPDLMQDFREVPLEELLRAQGEDCMYED